MADVDKIIEEQMKTLPQVLQDAISSSSLERKMQDVLIGQPLQEDQIDVFETEVLLVLLRLEGLDMFSKNLQEHLNISQKRADDISRLTNQIIFSPIERQSVNVESKIPENTLKSSDGIAPRSTQTTPTETVPEPKKEEVAQTKPVEPIVPPKQQTAISENVLKKPSIRSKLFSDIISKNGTSKTQPEKKKEEPVERNIPPSPMSMPKKPTPSESEQKPTMETSKPTAPEGSLQAQQRDVNLPTNTPPQVPQKVGVDEQERIEKKLNINESTPKAETPLQPDKPVEPKKEEPARTDMYREPIE